MKYVVLLASVLIQVCIGGLYSWSSFVPALRSSHGLSTAQTQVIFGSLIAVFTVAMIFAGKLLKRRGERFVASIGGVLFGLGYVIAAFSGGSFPVLLVGVGMVAGIGTGFAYVCPLAICMRWFPSRKGFITGIAVAGFGGGGVVLSSLAGRLLSRGVDVLAIFLWVGLSYGAVIVLAAGALKPPRVRKGSGRGSPGTVGVSLQAPFFLALVFGMFCGTFAGLLVIGNLKPLALSLGMSPAAAAVAIGAFAVGNAVGRIIWGWVADKAGHRTIPLSLAFLALAVSLLAWVSPSPTSLVGISALIGFGFGACFVVYAAQVASKYGAENVGSVYPLVFLAYGVAGITGPFLGGWFHDTTGSYTPAVGTGVIVLIIGLIASSWLLHREPPQGPGTSGECSGV